MKTLKLGIIGISEGNGHPYSWSAICNGYDPIYMAECPFPVIPAYLAQQTFPEAMISAVKVTHLWTQNKACSALISKATHIPFICTDREEMIPHVDAVLLARDDAENHLKMATPFLRAGLPIYIDKPLAYAVHQAEEIYEMEQYPGQIFTCSALSYSKDLQLNALQQKKIGKIIAIDAEVMKSWDKYAIHIIDPVFNLIKSEPQMMTVDKNVNTTTVQVLCKDATNLRFTAYGISDKPIKIKVMGEQGQVELHFTDTFNSFKAALQAFVNIVRGQEAKQIKNHVLTRIRVIEKGMSA